MDVDGVYDWRGLLKNILKVKTLVVHVPWRKFAPSKNNYQSRDRLLSRASKSWCTGEILECNLLEEMEKLTSLEFNWAIFIFLIFIFLILLRIFKPQIFILFIYFIFVIIYSVFLNDILSWIFSFSFCKYSILMPGNYLKISSINLFCQV